MNNNMVFGGVERNEPHGGGDKVGELLKKAAQNSVLCIQIRRGDQNNNPNASGPNKANRQQQQQEQQNVNYKQGPGVIGTQHVGVPQQTGAGMQEAGGVQKFVAGGAGVSDPGIGHNQGQRNIKDLNQQMH